MCLVGTRGGAYVQFLPGVPCLGLAALSGSRAGAAAPKLVHGEGCE